MEHILYILIAILVVAVIVICMTRQPRKGG